MPEVKRILLPVDFSAASSHAAVAAVSWSRRLHAELTMLHCFESPENISEPEAASLHESLDRKLRAFAAESLQGLKPRYALLEGKPAPMITAHAHEHETDLIMMPTRGESGFRAMLMGSATMGVLQEAECPVWTTAHAEPKVPPAECRRIVCAIDVSKPAVKTLQWARHLRDSFSAQLRVIHSVPAVDPRFASAAAARAHRHLVMTALDQYPELANAAGISEPLVVLETAGLTESITDDAAREGADLLVIGRGSVQGFLGRLRTNAQELIRTSPCPVISV